MKPTIDQVKRALAACKGALLEHPESLDGEVFVAIAEEWLARRTVRWADDSEDRFERLYCYEPGRWYGSSVRRDDGYGYDAYVNQQRDIAAESVRVGTAEEAREWLEARAVAAGFAVER